MTRMRIIIRILVLARPWPRPRRAATSCAAGRAPVFLVIDSLAAAEGDDDQQRSRSYAAVRRASRTSPRRPCTTERSVPDVFSDPGQASCGWRRRTSDARESVGAVDQQRRHDHPVSRRYRRADGRNIQGVDVPYEFDGAATGTVPATGTVTLGFQLVRHTAKEESPLVQLKTNRVIITTIADVTLYGRDQGRQRHQCHRDYRGRLRQLRG